MHVEDLLRVGAPQEECDPGEADLTRYEGELPRTATEKYSIELSADGGTPAKISSS